jgi:DNA-binding MarR family transcriptional regulator
MMSLSAEDRDALSPMGGWMDTLVRYVRSDHPDLTNRQMAILLLVYLTDGPHTVRGLAGRLAVSKPVVTRALNTLGALNFIRRQKDETDLRNVLVRTTEQGYAFLEKFANLLGDQIERSSAYREGGRPSLR